MTQLADIEDLFIQLVENVEQLKKLSQGEISAEALEPLQQRRKELLEVLSEKENVDMTDRLKGLIQRFQKCNDAFITNLTIRRELVKQDLYDTKKSRHALQGFKDVYTPTKESKKKQRVDTRY